MGSLITNRYAASGVEHVIKTACQRQWSKPAEWLLALPVVHFMRRNVYLFHIPETEDSRSPHWWGLENLMKDVKAFRKSQTPSM